MSDPDEWFLEWVPVNLPWAEPEGTWREISIPDTQEEERKLFGRTFEEMTHWYRLEFWNRRQKTLAQEGVEDEDALSEKGARYLAALRQEDATYLDLMWEEVEKLPARVEYNKRRLEALDKHHETYFAAQAESGMIVETSEGEHFLIGDVSVSGGVGTEHFPLRDKFIVRYCRLHPYPLNKRYLVPYEVS